MYKLYINIVIVIVLILFISYYSIHITNPYPRKLFEFCHEPYGRYMLYLVIYIISFYNELISLLLLLIVMFIHTDMIQFVKI